MAKSHVQVNGFYKIKVGDWLHLRPIFIALVATGLIWMTGLNRAGRPICRKVLKIMFWEVPPADWLIL